MNKKKGLLEQLLESVGGENNSEKLSAMLDEVLNQTATTPLDANSATDSINKLLAEENLPAEMRTRLQTVLNSIGHIEDQAAPSSLQDSDDEENEDDHFEDVYGDVAEWESQSPSAGGIGNSFGTGLSQEFMRILLSVDGIEGETTSLGFAGWIDVDHYSLTLYGDTPGQISIVKRLDAASGQLALACVTKSPIDQIVLKLVGIGSESVPRGLMTYTFSDCQVMSTDLSAASLGNIELSENVQFGYKHVEWQYENTKDADQKSVSFSVQSIPGMDVNEESVKLHQYEKDTAFIMMWIDQDRPELEDVCETIKEVFADYGVKACRADDLEHEDKITEVVLEQIIKSEFLVADLSGERPNVYYEVGHAHALGKTPFLYRKRGTKLHFDLSTHNVREYRNISELRSLLRRRLEMRFHG